MPMSALNTCLSQKSSCADQRRRRGSRRNCGFYTRGASLATVVELLARGTQVEVIADQTLVTCADNVLAGMTVVAGRTVFDYYSVVFDIFRGYSQGVGQ